MLLRSKFSPLCAEVRFYLFVSSFFFLVFSCLAHKEERFLLPILPSIHLLMGYTINNVYTTSSEKSSASKFLRILLITISFFHLLLSFYLGHYHQRGAEKAYRYIAQELSNSRGFKSIDIHVLAPCHSFPGYSFIYTDKFESVKVYSPDCSPRYVNPVLLCVPLSFFLSFFVALRLLIY